jgi:hypothetical protein
MKLEDYKKLVFAHTKQPKSENTIWAETSRLCMLFIEFRYMDILKYNLWNIANVYGGGETTLVIVHSGDNKDIIMETTKDWKNVRYIQAMEKNESVRAYDTLITSHDINHGMGNLMMCILLFPIFLDHRGKRLKNLVFRISNRMALQLVVIKCGRIKTKNMF